MSTGAPAPETQPRGLPNRPGLLLTVACASQFMVTLDVSIVNVALPAIGTDLSMSSSGLQYVINAYTLAFGGFLLLGGRAADLFGRRRMLLTGLTVFTVASLLGGLATTGPQLILARGAQGLGGAVLTPATLTILTLTFRDDKSRSRALGIWAAVLAGGGAVGSLLGGVLTAVSTWRWIFLVNVPVGLVVFLTARIVLADASRPVPRKERRDLDLLGALTATAGLVLLVFGIVETGSHPWIAAKTTLPMLGGVALLGLFVWVEHSYAAAPLMPLDVFRNRSLTGANLTGLLLGFHLFAMYYFVSLYLQRVLGYGPLRAGLAFLPFTAGIAVGSRASARLAATIGVRRLLVVGPLIWALGLAWMSRVSPTGSYLHDLLGPALVSTFGTGLALVPLTLAATARVERSEAGLASGLVNTSRQVGGSLGLAVLATAAKAHTHNLLAGQTPSTANVAAATTSGYTRAFALSALIALAAGFTALLVPDTRTRQPAVDQNLASN